MRCLSFAILVAIASLASAQTPSETVRKFFDALNKQDLDAAATLVKGGKASAHLKKTMVDEKNAWPTLTITEVSEKVSGDQATVSYTLTISGAPGAPRPQKETGNLKKSGSDWLVVPPSTRPHSPEVLPALAYMLTHAEVFANARQAAKQTVCLSNVKQVALACIMYMTDHNDKFEFKAANYKSSVMPYIKNAATFTCPLDKAGTTSYSFNAKLTGVSMDKVTSPEKTVMIYEGKGGKLNFRHDGKAAVAYADGHAKMLTKEQAKGLKWTAR